MNENKYLIIIVTVFMVLSASATPTIYAIENNASTSDFSTQELNSIINEVLRLVNNERIKIGLNPLILDMDLVSAAKIRSEEIIRLFDHKRPDNSSITSISSKIQGENIASGQPTAKQVMKAWMNSPGHKANILNSNFTKIGIGYNKLNNDPNKFTHYWVQLFGGIGEKTTIKLTTPSLKLVSRNKKVFISWNKVSKANGYEIYRSTTKKGKYSSKKVISSGFTSKFIDNNLKKGTYYYKIRSYSLVNKIKLYSNFSSPKTVKIK